MSDSIVTACPLCKKKLRLKGESASKKSVRCPDCKHEFSPLKGQTSAPVTEPAAAPPVKKEARKKSAAPTPAPESDEPAPTRKKKRRKKSQQAGMSPGMLAGIIIASLVIVVGGGIFLAVKMMPKKNSEVKEAVALEFKEYNHPQSAFRFDAPVGWEAETGGRSDTAWVKLVKGDSYIRISKNLVGSITMGPGGGDRDGESRYIEVNEMHRRKRAVLGEDTFKNFKEDPPENFDTKGYGPAAMSTFTGGVGTIMTTKIKGIHGTVKGSQNQVDIIAICPEKEFETLRPAFEKAVRTLQVGHKQ